MGTRGVRMLEAKKIVAAGHVSLDMTPAFPDFGGRANSSSDLARPGKMVNASHLAMTAGGLPLAECLGLAAAAGRGCPPASLGLGLRRASIYLL